MMTTIVKSEVSAFLPQEGVVSSPPARQKQYSCHNFKFNYHVVHIKTSPGV